MVRLNPVVHIVNCRLGLENLGNSDYVSVYDRTSYLPRKYIDFDLITGVDMLISKMFVRHRFYIVHTHLKKSGTHCHLEFCFVHFPRMFFPEVSRRCHGFATLFSGNLELKPVVVGKIVLRRNVRR